MDGLFKFKFKPQSSLVFDYFTFMLTYIRTTRSCTAFPACHIRDRINCSTFGTWI